MNQSVNILTHVALNDPLNGWELQVGDLAVYVGDSQYSSLKSRIIYQVVDKETGSDVSYATWRYRYRIAFDFENPTGTSTDTTPAMGVRGMKRVSLLDLATLRLHYDTFIQEYARYKGMEHHDDVDDKIIVG